MKKLSLNEMTTVNGGGNRDDFAIGLVCGASAALLISPAAVLGFAGMLACGTFSLIAYGIN